MTKTAVHLTEKCSDDSQTFAPWRELEQLYANSNLGLALIDAQLRYVRVNPVLADINGQPVESHIGRMVEEISSNIAETLIPLLKKVLECEKPIQELEICSAQRNGDKHGRYFSVMCYPYFGEEGSICGVNVLVRDITAQKMLALELEEQLAFERLISKLSAVFLDLPMDLLDQQIEQALGEVSTFLNMDLSTLLQHNSKTHLFEVTHEWISPKFQIPGFKNTAVDEKYPWLRDNFAKGRTLQIPSLNDFPQEAKKEKSACEKTSIKSVVWVPISIQGRTEAYICLNSLKQATLWSEELIQRLHFIGELFVNALRYKHSNEVLRKNEEEYRILFENVDEGIFFVENGKFVNCNRKGAEIFGLPKEKLIGAIPFELCPPTQPSGRASKEKGLEELKRALNGEHLTSEWLQVRGDGSIFPAEISLSRLEGGKNGRLVGILRDLSETKRREAEIKHFREDLARVEQQAAAGELLASIAHEINQPLCGILSNAQACRRLLAAEPSDIAEAQAGLDDIANDSKRTGEIIRRLKALFKQGQAKIEPVDINGIVLNIIKVMKSELALHNVKLTFDLAESLSPVMSNEIQLQQVVMNLFKNSIEAMSDFPREEHSLSVRSFQDSSGHVVVAVADTGPGAGSEELEKIFETFYTTKSQGMGMGLAISRSIIEAYNGKLWAERNTDGGMTFSFMLPVNEEAL